MRPGQEETDAEAEGADVDWRHPAFLGRWIVRHRGGGFRFWFDGDFVGHGNSLVLIVDRGESSRDQNEN